jgi:hypothetical protein
VGDWVTVGVSVGVLVSVRVGVIEGDGVIVGVFVNVPGAVGETVCEAVGVAVFVAVGVGVKVAVPQLTFITTSFENTGTSPVPFIADVFDICPHDPAIVPHQVYEPTWSATGPMSHRTMGEVVAGEP